MDIERLNKIREICFKKSKSRTKYNQQKMQANQAVVNSVRSPFSSRGRVYDKENDRNQVGTIDIKNCNEKGDTYKNLEKQVNQLYEIKQQRLDANVLKFNEKIQLKKQQKERDLKDGSKRLCFYKSLSPYKENCNSPVAKGNIKKCSSPNSRDDCIKLQRVYSPLITPKKEGVNKEQSGPFRIRRLKEMLTHLINFAAHPANTITVKEQEEMKLKLNGAFDRLIKYSKTLNNPFALGTDTSTLLSMVIEACLRDLELKLKAIALNGGSSEQDIEQVRTFISSITEQSAVLDVEELLPKIIVYLKRCKQSQSISMLKNLIERSNEKNARIAFN